MMKFSLPEKSTINMISLLSVVLFLALTLIPTAVKIYCRYLIILK